MKARCAATFLLLSAGITPAALAQDPGRDRDSQAADDLCFHARPAPTCRLFGVTDAGVSVGRTRVVVPGIPERTKHTTRYIMDWGVMRNLDPRNAIGGSLFLAIDDDGTLSIGPMLRYRRWLNDRQSLDFGVGTPIANNRQTVLSGIARRGSVLGLVKYNPVPWFGIAVRPEVLRGTGYACDPGPCRRTESTARVLVGVELSERPGAITSGIFGGLLLLGTALSGS